MCKTIMSIGLGVLMVSLYGCNTVKGAGNDIQNVGEVITKSATYVSDSIKNNPPGSKMDEAVEETSADVSGEE